MGNVKKCKDCVAQGVLTSRPAPYPGPRCSTHHRARKKGLQINAHERRLDLVYGITPEQYWSLYEAQGGVCYICRVSTGVSRRLAVDHDHGLCDDHPPELGCPNCIRALLCKRCNQLIGWYDVPALGRAIRVLTDPPASKVLKPVSGS